MKIIACTEGRSGNIEGFSLEILAAARSISESGDEIIGFFAGGSADAAAQSLGTCDRLIVAKTSNADLIPAEAYAALLRGLVLQESPHLVLVPYSASGLDVATSLAARTGWPLVSYVNRINHDGQNLIATAQIYGGKILADCAITLPAILMINPGAFPEVEAQVMDVGRITINDADAVLDAGKVKMLSVELPNFTDVNLTEVDKIVCVGRGIGDEASIDLARNLATMLGAEIAGSRPVVDSGWLPKLRQVGKSGQKVKPKLYLALGVSGAPEHLEGMAQAELIIAVNTDPKAPIFNVAHYGATCDLFDLVESLSERLQAALGH